jgi:cysteine desulfurase/selenocysteine lyase
MILSVTFEKTTFNELPYKLEAGTPHIAGAIGLGAAIDWMSSIDLDGALRHEHDLLAYGTEVLSRIPGLRVIGTAPDKAGVLSFLLGDVHPHDVGTVLDREGIAIRTGHHCAQPLMQRYGLAATARASLGFYNVRAEIDALAAGLEKVRRMFA